MAANGDGFMPLPGTKNARYFSGRIHRVTLSVSFRPPPYGTPAFSSMLSQASPLKLLWGSMLLVPWKQTRMSAWIWNRVSVLWESSARLFTAMGAGVFFLKHFLLQCYRFCCVKWILSKTALLRLLCATRYSLKIRHL